MSSDRPYYDDAVTRIKKDMMEVFGDRFKAYYEGDPMDIPKANLPCLIIEETASRIVQNATGTDMMVTDIDVRPVFNKADDFNAPGDTDVTEQKLRRVVGGRDPATKSYYPDTIEGRLRGHITLAGLIIDQDMSVKYGIQPRTDQLITSEAVVTITVSERVFVPNRQ